MATGNGIAVGWIGHAVRKDKDRVIHSLQSPPAATPYVPDVHRHSHHWHAMCITCSILHDELTVHSVRHCEGSCRHLMNTLTGRIHHLPMLWRSTEAPSFVKVRLGMKT